MQHAKTTPPQRGEQACECGCNYSFDQGEYGCSNCRDVSPLARARVLPAPGCETCQGTGRQFVQCGKAQGHIRCVECFPTFPGEIRPFLDDTLPDEWVDAAIFLTWSAVIAVGGYLVAHFGIDRLAWGWLQSLIP